MTREMGKGQPIPALSDDSFGIELVGWGKAKAQPAAPAAAFAPAAVPAPTRRVARFGWIPDLPDHRDYTYAVPAQAIGRGGPMVDLRGQCPPVYDQGHLGSCTANAIAAAVEFDMRKQGLHSFTPSRLFIYYNERAIEGHIPCDSGAMLRDGIKAVARWGDCPESLWPYDDTPAGPDGLFPPNARAGMPPSPRCYAEAVKHKAVLYHSVTQNLADMKGCLAEGYPFVFGFTVYESFQSPVVAQTGMVSMPQPGEAPVGGHAVTAVGYDDGRNAFIVRNSWGMAWGAAGYCFMPYAYLLDDNLATDFWTIRLVR